MVEFFRGAVDGATKVNTLPQGGVIYLQTDQEITIEFWNPAAGAYGAAETIAVPGDEISCPSNKARLTNTGSAANVTISAGS